MQGVGRKLWEGSAHIHRLRWGGPFIDLRSLMSGEVWNDYRRIACCCLRVGWWWWWDCTCSLCGIDLIKLLQWREVRRGPFHSTKKDGLISFGRCVLTTQGPKKNYFIFYFIFLIWTPKIQNDMMSAEAPGFETAEILYRPSSTKERDGILKGSLSFRDCLSIPIGLVPGKILSPPLVDSCFFPYVSPTTNAELQQHIRFGSLKTSQPTRAHRNRGPGLLSHVSSLVPLDRLVWSAFFTLS